MDGSTLLTRSRRRLLAGLAVALAVLALLGLHPLVRVTGTSMRPTLSPGEHLLVVRFWPGRSPGRGDVVTVHDPATGGLMVKRVAAVGGDRVGVADGVLVVNGVRLREPYVDRATVDSTYFGPVQVPAGRVFLLGDNRARSYDSRDFGAVPVAEVTGQVLAWP